MKKKFTLFCFILLCAFVPARAQFSRHIVNLRDKNGTPHTLANPQTYLSGLAIARRTQQNIAIDSTDLPITPRYLDSIRSVPNVIILNTSKWLNQVLIQTSSAAALAKIQSFPFVSQTAPIGARLGPVPENSLISARKLEVTDIQPAPIQQQRPQQPGQTTIDYGNATAQIRIHNGDFLHNWGFNGSGVNLAMMDAGFFNYETNVGVDSLRINNQIKETWDFVAGNAQVGEDHPHGFYCLSIIGANKPGVMVGSAPKANFYLYRTEDAATEYPVEEQNWAAAAERADSIGMQVFSTSLGYLTFDNAVFNYTYAQRNGNYAMMTRAGDLAAKKGIIVCNSAGNNGATSTDAKFIAVPGDGDSVMAVGACNTSGLIGNFSAWGPNSAGRIKPNFTSVGVGTSFYSTGGVPSNGNGTSFSCPNIAGFICCLVQAFGEAKSWDITDAVMQSAHKFSAPDDRFGYGIPDLKKAFVLLLKKRYGATITLNNCAVHLSVVVKASKPMQFELERMGPGETGFTTLVRFDGITPAFLQHNFVFDDTLKYQSTGAVSYRLKHVLGTDTSFYYNTHTINLANPCANNKILISPNPVKNNLRIEIGALLGATAPAVRVTAANGKLVFVQTNTGNNLNINTSRWAAGIYVVEIFNGNEVLATKRIVKE